MYETIRRWVNALPSDGGEQKSWTWAEEIAQAKYVYMNCAYIYTISVLPSVHKACWPNKPSVQNIMWCEMGQSKLFNVAIGSNPVAPSWHALNFCLGRTLIN